MAIGSKVPNFILSDENAKEVNLSKIESEKILLVFYASWCPHCQELLPKINEFAKRKNENKLKVIAISLDTSKVEWLNFINSNKLTNLVNVSDLQGWSSESAKSYFIYATPTMFLLDNVKKIIGKPITFSEIKKLF